MWRIWIEDFMFLLLCDCLFEIGCNGFGVIDQEGMEFR